MCSLPVQGRCGTKEGGRWTSSSPEWVRVISKWHIPCSHGFDFEYNVSFLRAVSNNSQIWCWWNRKSDSMGLLRSRSLQLRSTGHRNDGVFRTLRWNSLNVQLGFTFTAHILIAQQVTRPAIEQDEDDRAQYQFIIGSHYEPDQLVFIDESAKMVLVRACYSSVLALVCCDRSQSRLAGKWPELSE